jgi:hypothetical protein
LYLVKPYLLNLGRNSSGQLKSETNRSYSLCPHLDFTSYFIIRRTKSITGPCYMLPTILFLLSWSIHSSNKERKYILIFFFVHDFPTWKISYYLKPTNNLNNRICNYAYEVTIIYWYFFLVSIARRTLSLLQLLHARLDLVSSYDYTLNKTKFL